MLTKGDEYPIHQLPEPVAFAGTDRNFYDRYFFNGYGPDGSGFFAVAFGIYPHLNIADAHFSFVRGETQYCVHASRVLGMERMDLQVGPIRIEVLEPLQSLRITVADETGISADLTFEGRAFPIEEPRFTHRIGPRTFLDYTRMTQNGRYTGWIEVDGERFALAPETVGTRDRSWGVRPIGAADAQPYAPAVAPGFFWQWTPLNFADRSIFFHINADAEGRPFNLRSVLVPDGAGADGHVEIPDAALETVCVPGTRHPASGRLAISPPGESEIEILIEPVGRFQMRGIGYVSPTWGHGLYKGDRVVEREDIRFADLDPMAIDNLHVQFPSKVTFQQAGRPSASGIGVFEQLILGPYKPLGFTGMLDPAG